MLLLLQKFILKVHICTDDQYTKLFIVVLLGKAKITGSLSIGSLLLLHLVIDFQNIIFSFITVLYYNVIIFETAVGKFSIFDLHMCREETVMPLMINALDCGVTVSSCNHYRSQDGNCTKAKNRSAL